MNYVDAPLGLAVPVGLLIVLLLWATVTANKFTKLKMMIRDSWANLDVSLKRRYDLIPNLVETVKAYAAHEKSVMERVVEARNLALMQSATIAERAEDDGALVRAVNNLVAKVEAYPELRAADGFRELQKELINTEDRIAAARRFYNANVRDFNTMLASFPSSIIGNMGGHRPQDQFEIEDVRFREVPSV